MKQAEKDIEEQKQILLKFLKEELCKRPSMFVGSNDFEKVAHFFNGYTIAIEFCGSHEKAIENFPSLFESYLKSDDFAKF